MPADAPNEDQLSMLCGAIGAATDGLRFVEPADLRELAGGRDALRAKADGKRLKWLDEESGGLALNGADLTGATLSHAVLDGANLRGAVLTDTTGHSTDLSHAILEGAKFERADFSGGRFTSALAGEADFSAAMLEDAQFDHAVLRFANFNNSLLDGAVFAHADLWGASLRDTDADEASFQQARLDEADLAGGNFSDADFAEASLKKAVLTGVNFRGVNLIGAHLEGATLAAANLSEASLPRLNLLGCDLTHVRLAGAWLEMTRLQAHQLGGSVGEEFAGEYEAARKAYIGLEQNFRTLGNSEDASWAFRRRRIMGKLNHAEEARRAFQASSWKAGVSHAVRWISDIFVEWLCDYGESLWRVVRAFFATIITFAFIYGLCGALTRSAPEAARIVVRDPLDLLAYSFLNMLSTSAPDIGLRPFNKLVVIVSSMQGAIGIVLIGLFGYVLGNRMHK